ncbi:MAG: hypothetical protein LW630_01895 [Saprospiraceae bacterium]|jgi:hypothetical protein|nr:hypothetical protein [Saprospiraceae bacterium]
MQSLRILPAIFFLFLVALTSCKKEPEIVKGCTDPLADNYSTDAEEDDGTCTFQKRFLGEYACEFACKGPFASVFTTANLSITELIKKDEVNIIIESAIGPLPVMGKIIGKDTVIVDASLQNLSIEPGDIIPGAGTTPIKADAKVKTDLVISTDNKKLSGVLIVEIITREPTVISGFPIPAGFSLKDECAFTGTKK